MFSVVPSMDTLVRCAMHCCPLTVRFSDSRSLMLLGRSPVYHLGGEAGTALSQRSADRQRPEKVVRHVGTGQRHRPAAAARAAPAPLSGWR